MPMMDVIAATVTFADKRALVEDLTAAIMRWEGVPAIPFFADNTAAFVHDLAPDALGNASGHSNCVLSAALTPIGVLDREKKLGVTQEMTAIARRCGGRSGPGGTDVGADQRDAGRRVGDRGARLHQRGDRGNGAAHPRRRIAGGGWRWRRRKR